MNTKLGFIGGGNMAASLIGGLLSNGLFTPLQIIVFEPDQDRAKQLEQDFSIRLASDNAQLVSLVETVVIAVKPQVLKQVLTPLQNSVSASRPLLISIVAGITSDSIEQWLDTPLSIVRVMPNTPSLIGQGASGAYANSRVTAAQRSVAESLMNAVGCCRWVENQSDIDAVTALSGSGPAYFMLFIQALIESSVAAGIEPDTAKKLAIATAQGAAGLIEQSDVEIQQLIDNVTSPNGTTEAALNSFKQSNFSHIVATAFTAAKSRSEELAKELS